MTAFELRIWPGPGTWAGSTSSSPVGKMASVGLGMTRTRVRPTDASSPRLVGDNRFPDCSRSSPWRQIRPLAKDILAGSYLGGVHHDILVHEPGVLTHHHRVGFGRQGGPGHDHGRLTRPQRLRVGVWPASMVSPILSRRFADVRSEIRTA